MKKTPDLTDPAITGYVIADEQLSRLIVGQTGTLGGTEERKTGIDETQAAEKIRQDDGGGSETV